MKIKTSIERGIGCHALMLKAGESLLLSFAPKKGKERRKLYLLSIDSCQLSSNLHNSKSGLLKSFCSSDRIWTSCPHWSYELLSGKSFRLYSIQNPVPLFYCLNKRASILPGQGAETSLIYSFPKTLFGNKVMLWCNLGRDIQTSTVWHWEKRMVQLLETTHFIFTVR